MRVLAEQNRTFGYAIAASAALHAFLLLNLPARREAAPAPPEPPLVARLVEPPAAAPPRPAAPAPPPAAQKPQPPKPLPPKRIVRPKPQPAPRALTPIAPPPPALPEKSEEQAAEPPVAAAPPLAAQPAAPVAPVTPAQPAPDAAVALAGFREAVRQVAGRYKRYPRLALDNGWTGDVVVLIDMAASGSVSSIRVKTSSGYEVLDAQALEMFGNAVPQVPVPAALRGRAFTVELRAIYSLRDRPG